MRGCNRGSTQKSPYPVVALATRATTECAACIQAGHSAAFDLLKDILDAKLLPAAQKVPR
jgi:hypothetical protein